MVFYSSWSHLKMVLQSSKKAWISASPLHFTCPARQLLFACLNYWFSYQLTCLDLCGRKVTFPTRQSTRPGWPDRTFFLALVLIPSNLLILHSLRDYWSIKNDASWKISAFSQDLNFKTESFWILSLLQIDPSRSLKFWYGIWSLNLKNCTQYQAICSGR